MITLRFMGDRREISDDPITGRELREIGKVLSGKDDVYPYHIVRDSAPRVIEPDEQVAGENVVEFHRVLQVPEAWNEVDPQIDFMADAIFTLAEVMQKALPHGSLDILPFGGELGNQDTPYLSFYGDSNIEITAKEYDLLTKFQKIIAQHQVSA